MTKQCCGSCAWRSPEPERRGDPDLYSCRCPVSDAHVGTVEVMFVALYGGSRCKAYKPADDKPDQTPAEFTISELVELLQQNPRLVRVSIYQDSVAVIHQVSGYMDHTVSHINELRAKLLALKPPKEEPTLLVPMPLSLVRNCADRVDDYAIATVCKSALEKAGPQ